MSDNIKLAKERMIAQGFQPLENTANMTAEARSARALEYIALYMERIDKKLGLLVGDPDKAGAATSGDVPAIGALNKTIRDYLRELTRRVS